MENSKNSLISMLCGSVVMLSRRFLFRVMSAGPIPNHVAFILDGNRRFARKWNLGEGMGHRAGFMSLMALMKYCYELGIKYTTIYAFSIDNFRRKPHEVNYVMDLMLEKIEGMLKEERTVNQYGVRVFFIGNLKLLNDNVRNAAEMAMKATANNNKAILLICVAYTSTDEITHAAQESCEELWKEMQSKKANEAQISEIIKEQPGKITKEKASEEKQETIKGKMYGAISKQEQEEMSKERQEEATNRKHEEMSKERVEQTTNGKYEEMSKEKLEVLGKEKEEVVQCSIKLADIEKHMYMGVAPDVDILVRTSGETRLSNFLLWQTWNGLLYSTEALWPEIGLRHLVCAVLNFQKAHPFFEKRKTQL